MMENTKAYVAAFLVWGIYAGMHILSKEAFNGGMSTSVFVFYRQLLGTLFLLPFAFVLEWKTAPALPFLLAFKIFMLALVGLSASTNVFSISLDYTSPAMSSAAMNSIPVVTFLLALLFRMEKVNIRRLSGIAKISSVVLFVAGVVSIAFYTGPQLRPILHRNAVPHRRPESRSKSHSKWVLGAFLSILSNGIYSLWLVLQKPLLKEYPSRLLFTTMQCGFSAVQNFFVALAMERDFSRWKLASNLDLLSVAYCGIVVTGVGFFLQSWTIEKRGPVFLTMSTPLALLLTLIVTYFLLGEIINLGSIVGGILMVGGLYCFLWGKRRESKEGEEELVILPADAKA